MAPNEFSDGFLGLSDGIHFQIELGDGPRFHPRYRFLRSEDLVGIIRTGCPWVDVEGAFESPSDARYATQTAAFAAIRAHGEGVYGR